MGPGVGVGSCCNTLDVNAWGTFQGKLGEARRESVPNWHKAEMTTMGTALCVTWGQKPAPPKASLGQTFLV